MSSILDALKKLEQEKEDPKQDLNWPQPVNTKGAIYQSVTRRPSYKPFVAVALVLAAVSLGGWFVMTRQPKPVPEKEIASKAVAPAPKPQVAKAKPAEPKTDPDGPKPESMMTYKSIPRHASRMNRRPEGIPPNFTQDRTIKPKAEPKPDIPANTFTEEQVEALAEIMPQSNRQETSDLKALWEEQMKERLPEEKPSVSAQDIPEEPEPEELDEEMAALLERVPKDMLPPKKMVESGWLKLHAISWSDDPARRIAVINATLVKEGRKIDGALVSRIERDYVVIEKNGEELMLPFGNH